MSGSPGQDAEPLAQERERFADALHDEVLPLVFALRQDLLELEADEAPGLVGQVDRLTRELRATISAEHPALGERARLADALREAAGPACRRADLALAVDIDEGVHGEHRALTLACVRELAENAARHARASQLSVHLVEDDEVTFLTVVDDGIGLDAERMAEQEREGHLGLRRLQHRVRAAGGNTHIGGSAQGTAVTVVLPRAG